MAWTTISNALVAVGAKPFATTVQALRDNPIAIADGDAGAPRIRLGALEPLVAGTVLRVNRPELDAIVSTAFVLVANSTFSFLQSGTIRVRFFHFRSPSGTSDVRIRKTSGGTTTTLATLSSTAGTAPGTQQDTDVSVVAGDIIFLEHRNATGGSSSSVQDVSLRTAASVFVWPAPGLFGLLTNP